jgi:hypothetical protein
MPQQLRLYRLFRQSRLWEVLLLWEVFRLWEVLRRREVLRLWEVLHLWDVAVQPRMPQRSRRAPYQSPCGPGQSAALP